MPIVTIHGQPAHYDVSGDENAQALVLIHGSGGSRQSWPARLRTLAGARVYALDLPGHGESGGDPLPTVDALAAWVDELMTTLGASDVTLCGHSLGGAVALTAALDAPAWLSGIVLAGTGARLRVHPGILATVQHDFDAAATLMGQFLFGPDVAPAVAEAASAPIRDAGAAVLLADFLACDAFDLMERLGEIETRTLVVAATEDRLTPIKYARFLAEAISGARLHVLDGPGHMMALERPEAFAEVVAGFLQEDRR